MSLDIIHIIELFIVLENKTHTRQQIFQFNDKHLICDHINIKTISTICSFLLYNNYNINIYQFISISAE